MKLMSYLFVTGIIVLFSFLYNPISLSATSNQAIFREVGDVGEKKASEQGLTVPVYQKAKINGQKITFTESLYDGSSIRVAFLIESKDKKVTTCPPNLWEEAEFFIDGKEMMWDKMGTSINPLENGDYVGILDVGFKEIVPDSFVLSILSGKDLVAEIPIKRKGNSSSFPIKEKLKWHDIMVTYDTITFFPTTTKITMEFFLAKEKIDELQHFRIHVMDEHGYILEELEGGGSGQPIDGENVRYIYEFYFEPMDSVPESLTISPSKFQMPPKKSESVREKWDGKPVQLSHGSVTSLTVLDVEKEGKELTITYKITGTPDFYQRNNIWIENADGNQYPKNGPPLSIKDSNKYKLTFIVPKQLHDIYLVTSKSERFYHIKDLEMKVKLK